MGDALNSDNSLKPFFEPKGIAIIGARSTPGFGYIASRQFTGQRMGG